MKLSTRSRYGLRFLIELSLSSSGNAMYLGDIARRQGISEKYLSKLVIPLRNAKLITSRRGTNGGYLLSCNPEVITLREIIEALEGDINLVDCVYIPDGCDRLATCASRDVWVSLNQQISKFLEGITLASILENYRERLIGEEPFIYTI